MWYNTTKLHKLNQLQIRLIRLIVTKLLGDENI